MSKKRSFNVLDIIHVLRIDDEGLELLGDGINEKVKLDIDDIVYQVTMDDLYVAFGVIKEKQLKLDTFLNWYWAVTKDFKAALAPLKTLYDYGDYVMDYDFPEDDRKAVRQVFLRLDNFFDPEEYEGWDDLAISFDEIKEAYDYVDCYHRNRELSEEDYVYPDFMKKYFIDQVQELVDSGEISPEYIKRYRTYVGDFCSGDDVDALSKRCNGFYHGNAVYQQDFYAAKSDCLRLFELTKSGEYANILGDIYYNGRTTHGKPDYKEAYQYFSYAAANGYYGSIYKLADMYYNGYEVEKSLETAFNLTDMLYHELLDCYAREPIADFAQVALRLGMMNLNGEGTITNTYEGLYYLLQAKYAFNEMDQNSHEPGSPAVASGIDRGLKQAQEVIPYKEVKGELDYLNWWPVDALIGKDYRVKMQAKELKDHKYTLTFERLPKRNEEKPQRAWITDLGYYYCEYTNTVKGNAVLLEGKLPKTAIIDDLKISADDDTKVKVDLYLDKKVIASFVSEPFMWMVDKADKNGEMVRLVRVCFKPGGRQYDYLTDRDDLQPGDVVKVDGNDGMADAVVQSVTMVASRDLILPAEKYKRIY